MMDRKDLAHVSDFFLWKNMQKMYQNQIIWFKRNNKESAQVWNFLTKFKTFLYEQIDRYAKTAIEAKRKKVCPFWKCPKIAFL